MSSMCCAVLYVYISVYILLFLAKATWLLLPACKVWTFLWPIFFCCFFVFASFFRSVGLFFGKVVERAEPSRKGGAQAQAEARHLCDPVDNMDQNTKSRSGRTAAVAGSRQHATGWGSCQILVLVSGCGATCCPGCVHECVWGVCVCCDQHCWSTHSHTHTHPYTRTDTPRLCCNFFSFSLPCCCLPLPALVIIVFAFFSSFFLFLVNLLSAHLPCCCCWLSSLVRNVIKFLLVQQHSTLFSSP